MDIQWITGPLVGGVIGYITNGIAIKMLFRPLRPIYIGNFKIPFTPGLIPKEKGRLAASVGVVISDQLLNQEVIVAALTTAEIQEKILVLFDDFIQQKRESEASVEEVIQEFFGRAPVEKLVAVLKREIVKAVEEKVVHQGLGDKGAKLLLKNSKEKLENSKMKIFSSLVDSSFSKGAARQLGKLIDEILEEKAAPTVEGLIDEEMNRFLKQPMATFLSEHEQGLAQLRDYTLKAYLNGLESGIGKVMDTLDLAKIVRERIESFDVLELEGMILDLIQKELNAIIWLGAGLGFIMGFLNVII